MAGLVEQFCLQMLPEVSVDFLMGLCDEYRITVAEAKQEDKTYLVKVVLRHLTSDAIENSADQGAAIFFEVVPRIGWGVKELGENRSWAACFE